jgi:hypothetical protein
VIRNIDSGNIIAKYYVRVQHEQPGRTSIQSTLDWWETQKSESPEAYEEIFNPQLHRYPLTEALKGFNNFLVQHAPDRPKIFGNSDSYDNQSVIHAMHQNGIEPAWDYGCNQSLRTIAWIGRVLLDIDPKYQLPFKGHKHNALDDAIHESDYLYAIYSALKDAIEH